ncbi:MAG: BACON domain-containing protein [Candidatus Latescibacterota bacterium]|nr:MAG: BACON domain-containing protein [Candidatus Latescibacterota bacterium]
MSRIIIIAVAALAVAGAAVAQNGAICLFADPAGTDCNLTDETPGMLNIYVVHTLMPGATASQFWAPKPACMVGATWLSDVKPFPVTLGDSQTGVAVGYGGCQPSPLHILTIVYQTSGTTQADCAYFVRPHPNVDSIEAADCNENIVIPGGGKIYINSDLDCLCEEEAPPELGYSPLSLDFHENIQTHAVQIVNLGGGELSWTAVEAMPWMELNPQLGTNDGTVVVTVDRSLVYPGEQSSLIFLNSNGGTAQIPVRMDVVASLQVFPDQLDFGSQAEQLHISIRNFGDGIMSWSVSTDDPWISLVPTSGEGDYEVEVTVDRSGLSGGTYNGHIQITSDGGNAMIPVTMDVGPVLNIDPGELEFGYFSTYQEFDIENIGNGLLSWSVTSLTPWLTVDPISGTGDATIGVTADRTGLANGHHQGVIDVNSNGGSASVTVRIDVGPSLFFTPTTLAFTGVTTQATVRIRNIGAGTLEWTLAPEAEWITVEPDMGTDDATVLVTVDRCGLELGQTHQSAINITSNGGNGTVLIIAAGMPRIATSTNYLEFVENETEVRTFTVAMLCSEPVAWTATTASSWMTLNPETGTGTGDVTVTVEWPEGVEETELWGAIHIREVGGPGQADIAVRFLPGDVLIPVEKTTWGNLKSKYQKTDPDGE